MSDINPAHYRELEPEPIEVIEGWGLGFCLGNAIKYIARAGRKSYAGASSREAAIVDLQKARWYIDRAITAAVTHEAEPIDALPEDLIDRASGPVR